MRMISKLCLVIAAGLALTTPARAGSTVNPNMPATASDLTSAPIRGNFAAAYNDINNILGMFGGSSAPGSPTVGQDWLDTSTTPAVWKKRYNAGWGQIGTFNLSTGLFSIAAFSVPQAANTVFAGPTSGGNAVPNFRSLVGADLPNPGASSKGGVQSLSAVSNQFLTGLGTDGILTRAQVTGVGTLVAGATGAGFTIDFAASTLSGTIPNVNLANSSTTVNGQTCTLGSTCTVTATAATITVGTTAVAGGTTTRVLYNNAGLLGEYTVSGTGTVVAMTGSPSIDAPTITGNPTIEGVTSTGATGTGNLVFSAAPTFTGTAAGAVFDASTGFRVAGAATTGQYLRGNGTNFVSAVIAAGDLPLVGNASGSPSATFGVMKCDGTTTVCASGVVTAVGGAATDITVGTTTVSSGTTGYLLYNNAGVLGNRTIASVLSAGNGIAITGTTTAAIAADLASAANVAAGTANKMVDAAVAVSAAAPVALTPGATVTPDLNAGFNFTLTPNQSFTLANPSNVTGKVGRSFCVWITNDTTPRTIAFGNSYYAPGGIATITLTASNGAKDQLCGAVVTTTQINVTITRAYAQ